MIGGGLYLVDRCDVKRKAASKQAYGSKPVYTDHLSAVPCRLDTTNQRGFNSITAEWVVTTVYQLEVQPNRDIQEGDRITNIRLQDGTLMIENFEVDGGAIPLRGRMAALTILSLKKVS